MENPRPEELIRDKQARQKLSRLSLERRPTEEVKLAATAISLNVRLRPSDMPLHMQDRALRYTRSLLDSSLIKSRPNPTHLARALKKVYIYIY
jgi:dynein light chain LC8-type